MIHTPILRRWSGVAFLSILLSFIGFGIVTVTVARIFGDQSLRKAVVQSVKLNTEDRRIKHEELNRRLDDILNKLTRIEAATNPHGNTVYVTGR